MFGKKIDIFYQKVFPVCHQYFTTCCRKYTIPYYSQIYITIIFICLNKIFVDFSILYKYFKATFQIPSILYIHHANIINLKLFFAFLFFYES